MNVITTLKSERAHPIDCGVHSRNYFQWVLNFFCSFSMRPFRFQSPNHHTKCTKILKTPCYHQASTKFRITKTSKVLNHAIIQKTKSTENWNDTFRHRAVRLYNSLPLNFVFPLNIEKETFHCLLFKSIKNMKISISTWLCCEFCLLFNDDSPIQIPCSYVYRFFNISLIIVRGWTQRIETLWVAFCSFKPFTEISIRKILYFCFD